MNGERRCSGGTASGSGGSIPAAGGTQKESQLSGKSTSTHARQSVSVVGLSLCHRCVRRIFAQIGAVSKVQNPTSVQCVVFAACSAKCRARRSIAAALGK